MASRKQSITLGIALAVAIFGALMPVWVTVPLWVIAVLLFAWGLEPKRTEEFVGRLPYGSSYILKALAKLDSMLSKLARMLSRPTIKIKHRSLLLCSPLLRRYWSLVSWR